MTLDRAWLMAMGAERPLTVVAPEAPSGAPVQQRVRGLIKALEADGNTVESVNTPAGLLGALRLLVHIYMRRSRALFVTMPPFRRWFLVFLPAVPVILDWRDGWSVAMRTGYGGTVGKAPYKALVARAIEVVGLIFAKKVIVCTPGLLEYHRKGLPFFLKKKLVLIPNGHQLEIVDVAFRPFVEAAGESPLAVVCAGKFSEYGRERAERIMETLLLRYPKRRIDFTIIGADRDDNAWLAGRFDGGECVAVHLLPRMEYSDVIEQIRKADMAVAVVRDEQYELGTKVFDYVACGVPILDVFEPDSPFRNYFRFCFDTDYCPLKAREKAIAFTRSEQFKSCPDLLEDLALNRAGQGANGAR